MIAHKLAMGSWMNQGWAHGQASGKMVGKDSKHREKKRQETKSPK